MTNLAQALAEVLMDRFPDDGTVLLADPAGWAEPPVSKPLDFQLGWWAALTMVARTATSGLTDVEHQIVRRVNELAEDFIELVDGPTAVDDYAEILPHLHALQQSVMAQAAARAHPRRYRLLGGKGTPHDD